MFKKCSNKRRKPCNPVDLDAIRRGLTCLDELAKRPGLTCAGARKRCDEWLETETEKETRNDTEEEDEGT